MEALHQLESGHLSADPFEGDLVGTEDGWESASVYQQELVEEYRGLHEQRTQARKMISGAEAWQRISRRKATGYDGEDCGEAELLTTGDGLVKGDVCKCVPRKVALPGPGHVARPVEEVSGRVRDRFQRPREELLEEETEELRAKVAAMPEYMDVNLQVKSVMLELLSLMYFSGMIRFTGVAKAFVCMFTVVKELYRNLSGRVEVLAQRLIFDGRRMNLFWRPPPKMQPVSASQFSYLDASSTTRRGRRLVGFQGDVPCFYYTLLLPFWMNPWFCIAGIKARELVDHLRHHHGVEVPLEDGMEFVCVAVVLMGWSWGCWVGQTVLEDLMVRVPNLRAEWRLMYGGPLPVFLEQLGQVLHFQYIDDFGGWMMLLVGPDGQVDLGLARKVLRLCVRVLRKFGFGCHKMVLDFKVEPLGVVVEDRGEEVVTEMAVARHPS